jgi:protein-S-isoprenylcysteine O-methyltransferase Ste14
MAVSLTGLGVIPLTYVTIGFPKAANYTFSSIQGWIGTAAGIGALSTFYLTHRSLGRNWSVSLDVRETHRLVTSGIYRRIRHPMYTAFWMWAIAQGLLLPNWIAGLSGLLGFGILYTFRIRHEERLMIDTFGDEYLAYMRRTGRLMPRIF